MNQPRPILPNLSVVIPTLGRETLWRCAESIADGSHWPAKLILVDQGANVKVAELVETLRSRGIDMRHIEAPRRGAAAGRNRGFATVETDFIAATDDDCTVAEGWLQHMWARLQRHPMAFVTGRVDNSPTQADLAAPSLITGDEEQIYRRPLVRRDPLFSNNMGFAKAIVDQIGPMDEHPTLRYAEDAEWSYRALRGGVPIVYAPDVKVAHVAWRDTEEMALTYRRYARSQGSFYGCYIRRGDGFIGTRAVFDLLRGPWLLIRGVVTANRELSMVGRAYLGQLPAGIRDGWLRGGDESASADSAAA